MAISALGPDIDQPPARAAWRSLLGSRRSRSSALWGMFFIAPQFVGMIVFIVGPVVYAFLLSLMHWDGFGARTWIGFDNYRALFQDGEFRGALWHTLFYTLIAVPGSVIASLILALCVNRVWGRTVYRIIFFLPTITSSVAVSLVWLWMLNGDFGLLNNYLREWFHLNPPDWLVSSVWVIPSIAFVSVWAGLGFNMVIFLAGLQGIPSTYIEAAQIDGASKLRQFFNITLPLLSPTTFFVTIIAIINSFQVFDLVFVMTNGGPGTESSTMVFEIYKLAFVNFSFGRSAAVAVVLFVMILVLTLFQFWGQRRWVTYDA